MNDEASSSAGLPGPSRFHQGDDDEDDDGDGGGGGYGSGGGGNRKGGGLAAVCYIIS